MVRRVDDMNFSPMRSSKERSKRTLDKLKGISW